MHSRVEIIKNQKEFSYNIKKDLKKDFFILNEKKNLEKRFEKIKIEKEISAFFINEKNIYPKFYAWWDRESEKVEILLYETR